MTSVIENARRRGFSGDIKFIHVQSTAANASSDELDLNRYNNIGIIKKAKKTVDEVKIKNFIEFAYKAKMNNSITKNDYVREFKKIVPKLTHIEKGRNLDQKM